MIRVNNGYIELQTSNGDYNYDVALTRVDTHEKIKDLAGQLEEKDWATKSIIKEFVTIACKEHSLPMLFI